MIYQKQFYWYCYYYHQHHHYHNDYYWFLVNRSVFPELIQVIGRSSLVKSPKSWLLLTNYNYQNDWLGWTLQRRMSALVWVVEKVTRLSLQVILLWLSSRSSSACCLFMADGRTFAHANTWDTSSTRTLHSRCASWCMPFTMDSLHRWQ